MNYTESESGITCTSATIFAPSCSNGVCEHTFNVSSSSCSSFSTIIVTASGTNSLGSGPRSNPVSINGLWAFLYISIKIMWHATEFVNQFVTLTLELPFNQLICSFIYQQTTEFISKSCSIIYGLPEDNCRGFSQSSKSFSNDVYVGLPISNQVSSHRCFTVTATNGTFIALVEGSFVTSICI